MRKAMLTARHCKVNALHFQKIVPTDIHQDIRFDSGVTFKLGIVNSNTDYDFNVPNIRTTGTKVMVHTFRDLTISQGDKIEFNNKIYYVENFSKSYYDSSQFKIIEQYFITLK